MLLILGHRSGRLGVLDRLGAFAGRVSGLPPWAALPLGIAAGSLLVALLGMYWDISLHVDNGRDPGPLANPAHYLILVGLFGTFAAGTLALSLAKDVPGPAAVRISDTWHVPVGGLLLCACGTFALLGFPLDDLWHRLFGQDVTLWGPTHLMLFGGAGLSLIGLAVLMAEGKAAVRIAKGAAARERGTRHVFAYRRIALMGGLLAGLSTFQGEYDFGIPQYPAVLQPLLIGLAAGVALVAARGWIGPGGALAAVGFFFVARGIVSLVVGLLFGEVMPALPLYVPEALCVEIAALVFARRTALFTGAASGALLGTLGFAGEWGWTHLVYRLPWHVDLLPEGLILAVVGGVAGGIAGSLLAGGLRGELPAPRVARIAALGATLALAAGLVVGLHTSDPHARATLALRTAHGTTSGTVTITPPSLAHDAEWVNLTAWQGNDKLRVAALEEIRPGVFRLPAGIPAHGGWKSLVRVHKGAAVVAAPVFMPRDRAIGVPEVPARSGTRRFIRDTQLLQRERRRDVAGWIWGAAGAVVLALFLVFIAVLSWGVGRVGRRISSGGPPARPPGASTPPAVAPPERRPARRSTPAPA